MRFIRGMLVLLFVAMLAFAVSVMTVPTQGDVAMPLGPWYEKATGIESAEIEGLVPFIWTLTVLIATCAIGRIAKKDYRNIIQLRRVRFSLKFPLQSGQ